MADLVECGLYNCNNIWSIKYFYSKCDKCYDFFCKDHLNFIPIEDDNDDYSDNETMQYCDKCYKEIFNLQKID